MRSFFIFLFGFILFLPSISIGCSVYNPDLVRHDAQSDPGFDSGIPPKYGMDATFSDRFLPPFSLDSGSTDVDLQIDPDGETFPDPPSDCSGGECFWSDPDLGQTCRSAGIPDDSMRPSPSDQGDVGDIFVAISRLWIGKTLFDGTEDNDAWRSFGLDIDGLCTDLDCSKESESSQAEVSCNSNSPQIPIDGDLCRDNTFSRLHPIASNVPEIGEVFGVDESVFNCELRRGSYSAIIRIRGYNGQPNDDRIRLDFYSSGGLSGELPPWTCPSDTYIDYPLWRPSRQWLIDINDLDGEIVDGEPYPDSKSFDENAFVRDGYIISHHQDTVVYRIASRQATFPGWVLRIQHGYNIARIEQAEDSTWKLKDGILAGRISKENLLLSFREVGFCAEGDSKYFYDSVAQYIDEYADVLISGENDPEQDCDALSVGIGYESSQITPGPAAELKPIVDCCLPENMNTPACKVGCGDGILFGSELCDTAIPEGEPDSCPTSCQSDDPCIFTFIDGEDCQSRCRETTITELIDDDGCCPSGANANIDSDCPAICGNQILESGEFCDPVQSCPTSLTCAPDDVCRTSVFSGEAENCTSQCHMEDIVNCTNGDGCCPSSCKNNGNTDDPAYDDDCPEEALCGNGLLDPAEQCDNTSSTPCPMEESDCLDTDDCTADQLVGNPDQCTARCSHTQIVQHIDADGCCPVDAFYNSDNDCPWQCGNDMIEPPYEACDDGNTISYDGCSDACQVESDLEICTGRVTEEYASTTCRDCMCQSCTSQAMECFFNYSEEENQKCIDVLSCGSDTCCVAEECFCGTQNELLCLLLGGNGPCKQEILIAADADNVLDVNSRMNNTTYPIGRANALVDCLQTECSSECLSCQ